MGYFDKFPTLYYDVKNNKNYQVVVDILRRVQINSKAVEGSMYGEYVVKDQDRPDTIAHKLYGDSDLHWVILLFNEIHNPYYEWPMAYHDFARYCEDKYPGKAFLLELDNIIDSPLSDVRKRRDHKVVEGYYAYGITGGELVTSGKRAYVLCWDRTMNKAIVVEESGSFEDGDSIGIGITGTGEATASGTIRRIQLNTEALHHFETDQGHPLAPLATYSGLVQTGASTQNAFTLDEYGRYAPVPFEQTLLGAYLLPENEAQDIIAVTNHEYETRINEARRSIKLPSPDIVREIVSRFESILNEEF